ncbi:hypothetical protein JGU71_28850 [Antrihabitans sp. YC3-6]|uniref:Uncharacterized protein n=1 Tax=Antrihabitans stalagmiti TaxID=2799499 RepID=A0A934NWX5_9NOCA|nr:hypothetical protein [Antrihabitans stalagmiti]MBJ8342906.1 hypothetical protein [Antrihabitans stalagmiti]
MLMQLGLDTVYYAVDQPVMVQPPGGERFIRILGIALWAAVIGAVLGIIAGGGWMWVDHISGQGATGGRGWKLVAGAVIGTIVSTCAASWVTFAMQ